MIQTARPSRHVIRSGEVSGWHKAAPHCLGDDSCETVKMMDASDAERLSLWWKHILPVACIVVLCMISGCAKSADQNQAGNSAAMIQRSVEKGPIRMTVRITPAEPRLSDLVEMDVEVAAQPDVEIRPPAFGAAVGDFIVRDYSERTPVAATGIQQGLRVFHYQLEPAHSGIHLIRSVAIEFIDNRKSSAAQGKVALIESEPIEVKVTSELSDQVPDLGNLEPMLPPQPIEPSRTLWWILLAGLAVALAVAVRIYGRRKYSRVVVPRQKSPEEVAHETLAQLLAEDLPSRGLFREFYIRLTGVVRLYIEGTTGLRAPEQTTEEFLKEIRTTNIFPAGRSIRLQEFLEAADMVKYAGQQPHAEQLEHSIMSAKEFITPAVVTTTSEAASELR